MATRTAHGPDLPVATSPLAAVWLTATTLLLCTLLFWKRPELLKAATKLHRLLSQAGQGHNENGIFVVHSPEDADFDIVAVPGLGAHPIHTWSKHRNKSEGTDVELLPDTSRVNWLLDQEYLQFNFPKARIMIFCYDASWMCNAPVATLGQRAKKLLRDLQRQREGGESSRPLLFIGHSLGGVVVKQALCETERSTKFKPILDSTLGVIFLGTPHLGSPAASLAVNAVAALALIPFLGAKATLLKTLCRHSTELSALRDAFSRLVRTRSTTGNHFKLYSIIETKETSFLGIIPLGLVVDRDSGTIESGYDPIEVDTDHKDLNKCCTNRDQVYVEIVDLIEDLVSSECLRALASVAKNIRQQDPRIDQAVRMTGEEVRSQPAYTAWQASKTSDVLWLVGKMGTGKSTLLKRQLQESQKANGRPSLQDMLNDMLNSRVNNVETSDTSIVASYFYSFSKHEVELQSMLQSLIFQLLYQERRFFSAVRGLWRASKLEGRSVSTWSIRELSDLFDAIVNFQGLERRIELFIDALDESDDSQGVIEQLKSILNAQGERNVVIKVLAASRHSRGVTRLPASRQVILENHNSDEIKKVIQQGVSRIQILLQGNRRIQFLDRLKEFEAVLTRKAQNTILWVSLTLSTVQGDLEDANFSIKKMMDALEDVADDLEELYSSLIDKFQTRDPALRKLDIEQVRYRLQWAAYAIRNLTIPEYCHAVALQGFVHRQKPSSIFLDSVINLQTVEDARTALTHCGGFLDIQAVSSAIVHLELHSMGVQLTHGSVLTFLHKPKAGPLQLQDTSCRLEVIDACIAYMEIVLEPQEYRSVGGTRVTSQSMPVRKWGESDYENFVKYLDEHPLLCYIWSELDMHLGAVHGTDLGDRLKQLQSIYHAIPPQTCVSFVFNAWVHLVARHLPVGAGRRSGRSQFQKWILATNGVSGRTSAHLAEQENLEEIFWRHMITATVRHDCFVTLKAICQIGILAQRTGLVSQCVEQAVLANNFGMLSYLGMVQHDPQFGFAEALTRSIPNAIFAASKAARSDMLLWLLNSSAEWGGRHRELSQAAETALADAVTSGDLKVVESLLQYGVDPNSQPSNGPTPLQVAAQAGHLEVVKLLIKQGADRKRPHFRQPRDETERQRNKAIMQEIFPSERTLERSETVISRPHNTIPHRRPLQFVGREAILETLRSELEQNMNGASPGFSIALVGLGGVGKTSIALEFAYRIHSTVAAVLWLTADSSAHIRGGHVDAARAFDFDSWDRGLDFQGVLRSFYSQLADVEGPKVIIWDDVSDESVFLDAFSIAARADNVLHLITTRNRSIGLQCARSIQVPTFSIQEGSALVRQRAYIDQDDGLSELVTRLGGLPLALDQAAAYIAQTKMTVRVYLQLYDNAPTRMLERGVGSRVGVFKSWDISLRNLRAQSSRLLSFLSVLSHEEIPRLVASHEAVKARLGQDEYDIEDSLGQLGDFSLIALEDAKTGDPDIRIHRLVQAAVRARQPEEELWRNQKLAVQVLDAIFPSETSMTSLMGRQLVPHALTILNYDVRQDEESFSSAHNLSIKTAKWLLHTGHLQDAKNVLDRSFAARAEREDAPTLELMELMQTMASVDAAEHRYHEAEEYYRRALEIGQRHLYPSDFRVIEIATGLADTLAALGSLDRAMDQLELFSRANHEAGELRPITEAKLYCSRADISLRRHDFHAAENDVKRALDIADRRHPVFLDALRILVAVLEHEGDLDRAESNCRRALERAKYMGLVLAEATFLHFLARIFMSEGKMEEAEQCAQEALGQRENALRPSHPDIDASRELLIEVKQKMAV